MLTPDYIDQIPDALLESYLQAVDDILADMARRIIKTGKMTTTAKYQKDRLKAMGAEYEYVMQTLQSYTDKTQGELRALFEEACETSLLYDDRIYRAAGLSPKALKDSPALMQLLKAGIDSTNGLFRNLTRTTANASQKQFVSALDRAWMQISSGGFSYQEAIKTAIRDLCKSGVAAIDYPSGHTDSVDVAARRAILTGVSQTSGKIGLAHAKATGSDLMETTAHAGARPSHAVWQGKIVSFSGKSGYLTLDAIGYGRGDGFKGWNCKHDWFPYFPGLSETSYSRNELDALNNKMIRYKEERIPYYDALQRQRAIERSIRRWKREQYVLEKNGQDAGKAAAKVAAWQKTQREFIRETGMKRDYFRERAGKQLSR